MDILYLDNFRGFKDTKILFTEVNFFVGENSTGKTSVLSLIKILSSINFWLSGNSDFNVDDCKLGNFNDIVSVESKNKRYFYIGILGVNDYKNKFFLFLRFKEKAGSPYPDLKILYRNEDIVYIREKENKIQMKHKKISSDTKIEDLFDKIIKESHKGIKGWINTEIETSRLIFNIYKEKLPKKLEKIPLNIFLDIVMNLTAIPYFSIAPIRTKPRRTYDEPISKYTADGQHTPYMLRKHLASEKFKILIENVGKNANLYNAIDVSPFGKTNTSPFQIEIVLNKLPLTLNNVGYGVSQSLPIIIELCAGKGNYLIQQPEVHLHPRAQAAIGELLYKVSRSKHNKLFIETHSDYLIDRFRQYCRKNGKRNSQVLFFNRGKEGNIVHQINIEDNGLYSKDQPKEFREFFLKEQLANLGIEE